MDGIKYATAEHYIQYKKSILFGDMVTANKILRCETALEAKKLSYSINGFNMPKWLSEGFEISAKGIREKFIQNSPLKDMLKETKELVLAEVSRDKIWGTGIPLRDLNALCTDKWESRGWLSRILHNIREELLS